MTSTLPPPSLIELTAAMARELPESVGEKLARALLAAGGTVGALEFDAIERAVAQPASRDRCRALLEVWRTLQPEAPTEAVAWALRSAAAADAWHRQHQSIELVWTGPAPHGSTLRRTDQALLELVNGARGELLIVMFAAYRVPVLLDAIRRALSRGVQLTFVAEDPAVSQGKVSFDPVEALGADLAAQARVLVWPLSARQRDDRGRHGTLHAKCAVADRHRALISSANFTEYAMEINMELGVLVEGGDVPADIAAHFEALQVSGVLVQRT